MHFSCWMLHCTTQGASSLKFCRSTRVFDRSDSRVSFNKWWHTQRFSWPVKWVPFFHLIQAEVVYTPKKTRLHEAVLKLPGVACFFVCILVNSSPCDHQVGKHIRQPCIALSFLKYNINFHVAMPLIVPVIKHFLIGVHWTPSMQVSVEKTSTPKC